MEELLNNLSLHLYWIMDKRTYPGWSDIRQTKGVHTFYWIREGRGVFRGEADIVVRAGMLFYLKPGLHLSMETDDRYPLRITMVLVSAFNTAQSGRQWRPIESALPLPMQLIPEREDAIAFDAIFREITDCWVPGQPDGELITKSLLFRLIQRVLRIVRTESAGSAQAADAFEQAKQTIDRGYAKDIKLRDLAAVCGISESHLRSLFQRHLGQSPKSYLGALRNEHAKKQLLYTDNPMKAIADSCGYADEFHFSKSFKKQNGMPPKAWKAFMLSRP
ncbi:AraC family transcriptional regulator [Paenibacillus sp. LHD-117]|uniref:helix-turn-helix transcriptional regulator n=1 Tax=Paenibacillus sp. LHD-117 TaxID=3071412 RepID=UPI0027E04E52|nr:AraC family transcriptional regulator [Paenibacillus sp. LHD-117]MDQ6419663.1 AraC family transcriptional regulator [Paenibacillus sp. LHD-117]